MTRRRIIIVHVAIALLIIIHSAAIVTATELWPFSRYPMYSELNSTRTMKTLRLVGITDESPPREIPIDAAWLRKSFNTLARKDPAQLDKAVRTYYKAYKNKRPPGVEPGPPFVGVRLYEQTSELRTDGANADRPDRAVLLIEVMRDKP